MHEPRACHTKWRSSEKTNIVSLVWNLNNDPDDTKNDTKKVYRYLFTTQEQAHRHQDTLVVAEEGGARGVTGSLQLAK